MRPRKQIWIRCEEQNQKSAQGNKKATPKQPCSKRSICYGYLCFLGLLPPASDQRFRLTSGWNAGGLTDAHWGPCLGWINSSSRTRCMNMYFWCRAKIHLDSWSVVRYLWIFFLFSFRRENSLFSLYVALIRSSNYDIVQVPRHWLISRQIVGSSSVVWLELFLKFFLV